MAETIKEFLVALGFKVDERGYQKFESSVARLTHVTIGLGEATVASATAIGVAVERVARYYEDLYYASQRTGASVAGLRATEFAVKQIGLTSDASRSAVERFAYQMRTNPGLRALAGGMGIDTADSQRGVIQMVERLKKQFGEGGYFVASRYAEMFGMDENTFRMMWMNLDRLKHEQSDQEKRMKSAGLDSKQAAEDFTRFGHAMNTLSDNFAILAQRIAHDFLPAAEKVVGLVNSMVEAFNRLNNSTGGGLGVAGTVVTGAAGAYVGKRLLGRLFGRGAAAAAETAASAGGAGTGVAASAARSVGGRLAGLTLGPLGWFLAMTTPAGATGPEGALAGKKMSLGDDVPGVGGAADAGIRPLGNGLSTVTTSRGRTVTVASAAATDIKGFLDDLEARGAPFKDLGGYNPRKIFGTNVWSKHAEGTAVDIDQMSRNVVSLEFARWSQEHETELREIMRARNIKSGGDFTGRLGQDFGHFEWTGALGGGGGEGGARVAVTQNVTVSVAPGPNAADTARRVKEEVVSAAEDITRYAGQNIR